MEVKNRIYNKTLYVLLSGELDEHSAYNTRIKLDEMFGDTSFPPKFSCSKCPIGTMYPIYYKGVRGNTFKFGE